MFIWDVRVAETVHGKIQNRVFHSYFLFRFTSKTLVLSSFLFFDETKLVDADIISWLTAAEGTQ